MRTRRRTLSVALASAIALAGCSETTPPLLLAELEGDLQSIGAPAPISSDGFLGVVAYPVDPEQVIELHERVKVAVSTSRGDSETVLLQRGVCDSKSEGYVQCRTFLIGLHDGRSANELALMADAVDARLNRIGASNTLVAYAFSSLSTAMQQLHLHPAVSFVEFNHIVSVEPVGPSIEPVYPPTQLHGALPLTKASVTANDGRLSIAVGDVITFTYRQPSGGTLTSSVTVQ